MIFLVIIGIATIILFFKRPFWGLIFLLILIPFHAFLVTAGAYFLHLTNFQKNILAFWKEFVLIILILRILWDWIHSKKFPFSWFWFDWLILALFIISIVSIPLGTKNWVQGIWGIRYDFELFAVVWVVRSLMTKKEQILKIIFAVSIPAVLVILFGIAQSFWFSADFLVKFGYSQAYGWTPDIALQASQVLPETITIPGSGIHRILSTLAGPNQLGIFLAVLITIFTGISFYLKDQKLRTFLIIESTLALLPLYYTFSRAAWLALLFGLATIIAILAGQKFKVWLIGFVPLVVLAYLIIRFAFNKFYLQILSRAASSTEHLHAWRKSWETFKAHPIGLGIGKAGLVSFRFPENGILVNESWWLQVLNELGFLGLGVLVGIWWGIWTKILTSFKKHKDDLIKGLSLGVGGAFVAVTIHMLFLHTWSDITLTVVFGSFVGLVIKSLNLKGAQK